MNSALSTSPSPLNGEKREQTSASLVQGFLKLFSTKRQETLRNIRVASKCSAGLVMSSQPAGSAGSRRRRIPRSFKELTPSNHFSPRTFFYEMVWKAWLTPRCGECRKPEFPKLPKGKVAITWIGHASFLVQFNDLNVL